MRPRTDGAVSCRSLSRADGVQTMVSPTRIVAGVGSCAAAVAGGERELQGLDLFFFPLELLAELFRSLGELLWPRPECLADVFEPCSLGADIANGTSSGQRFDAADAGCDGRLTGDLRTAPPAPSVSRCVPPQSSRLKSETSTTRTSSPYFSPKNAMAPRASALVDGHDFGESPRYRPGSFSFTRPSIWSSSPRVRGAKCEKSKRSRSRATSEPACLTCGPSVSRRAACSRCVMVWCEAAPDRERSPPRWPLTRWSRPRLPWETRTRWAMSPAMGALSVEHVGHAVRAGQNAAIAHLPATFGVERGCVEKRFALVSLGKFLDFNAVFGQCEQTGARPDECGRSLRMRWRSVLATRHRRCGPEPERPCFQDVAGPGAAALPIDGRILLHRWRSRLPWQYPP